jgi:phage repressor protein C with HTH and peptisase S24 domain
MQRALLKIEMTAIAKLHNLLPMVEKRDADNLPIRHPEFALRLQQAMADAGLSVTDIKNRLKVTYEMARRYSLGQAMPRQQKLQRLAEVVGKSPSYLAYGTHPLNPSDEQLVSSTPHPIVVISDGKEHAGAIQIRKVKLRLSAGIAGFAIEPIDDEDEPIYLPSAWLQKRGFKPENLLALSIKGQSMEPSLFERDTVIIHTANVTLIDSEVYAVNYEGEAVVKRMVKDNGQWWLTSDNPDQRRYPRKQCAGEACLIIGQVVRKESDRI